MKKEYMTPELMVIACRTTCLMAGSLQKSNTPASAEGTGVDDVSGGGIGLSKSGWNWSDEPEMDY